MDKQNQSEGKAGEAPDSLSAGSYAGVSNLPSFEQLRDRIVRAVNEITRLRAANASLAERVADLEARQRETAGKTLIALDDDPEELHDKLSSFLQALDHYLEANDEPA